MADNWLEKKQAALSGGPTVIRKVNPSVEQLLRRIADGAPARDGEPRANEAGQIPGADGEPVESVAVQNPGTDPLRQVKMAQLEAITRAAKTLFPGMQFECQEGDPASIQVLSQVKYEALGKAVLAMQLKAAELGLNSFEPQDGILKIFR